MYPMKVAICAIVVLCGATAAYVIYQHENVREVSGVTSAHAPATVDGWNGYSKFTVRPMIPGMPSLTFMFPARLGSPSESWYVGNTGSIDDQMNYETITFASSTISLSPITVSSLPCGKDLATEIAEHPPLRRFQEDTFRSLDGSLSGYSLRSSAHSPLRFFIMTAGMDACKKIQIVASSKGEDQAITDILAHTSAP
jgi:hypothetical protein